MNRKKLFRWVKIIIIVYCLLGLAFYYLQDYLLFHPVSLDKEFKYNFKDRHEELNIPFSETSNINIIRFLTNDSLAKGVVLYFHGNRDNIGRYARFAPYFTKHGYEVWMIDYPGYGKSTGTFNEATLYEWSLQFYKLARARFAPEKIIIYGKSLGTGIATQLASIRNCRYLILETPYYSVPSLMNSYFPIYPVNSMIHFKIPTWQYLQEVTDPVVIFQGTSDWVIPYRNARRLKPHLKKTDQFITVKGASHNDLFNDQLVIQNLDSILNK